MRRMYSLNQLEEIANARVEALVEGGTLDNAKPLYFHPIFIYLNTESLKYAFTMIIINNDETVFTKSSLIAYIKETAGRYLVNGSYHNGTYYLSPSLVSISSNMLYLIGVDNLGNIHSTATNTINFEDIINNASELGDNVNKIN